MISILVLLVSLLVIVVLIAVVGKAIIKRQQIIGRPPIPVPFFLLGKTLVVVNLAFLFIKGLDVHADRLFGSNLVIDIIALTLLVVGTVILILSVAQLNKDLIFGLSSATTHRLQTRGMYAISRHPFYLGFLIILFSSCLFSPHYINIPAFAGAWVIHHFIMVKEEQFLLSLYGEEYEDYMKRVNRYITFQHTGP